MYNIHNHCMTTLQTLRQTVAVLMAGADEGQGDLGRALRLSQGQISRKQSGASMWTLDDCDKLAAHYGLTVSQLLAGPADALTAAGATLTVLRGARRIHAAYPKADHSEPLASKGA
jgi:hypothetical protein